MNLFNCAGKPESTHRTLVQIKEKWKGIFDKYKSVSANNNNNNKTERDRKTCEFYDDIDEFMASSDKVSKCGRGR